MKQEYLPDGAPDIIFDTKPEWVDLYRLAIRLALENIDPGPGREGWLPHMTCMPGLDRIWVWDSCFMAIYAKYLNGIIAPMNNLDDLYQLESPDGYLSMAYDIGDGRPSFGSRINPPLPAWSEWLFCRFSGDRMRAKRVLPKLTAHYAWMERNRRHENGLYFFEDSNSSGMDNSPRGGYTGKLDGESLCWVDLAAQMVLAARCIAELAQFTGNEGMSEAFRNKAQDLSILVNQYHYSRSSGFYFDCYEGTMNFLSSKTAAGFWPLLAQVATPEQADALVAHLKNTTEFSAPHPVPSLSMDDPNYAKLGYYWLGSVWPPMNYMIVKGLEKYGKYREALEITRKHLDQMALVRQDPQYDSIWECYAPEAPRPAVCGKLVGQAFRPLVRDRFVGWGALGPVAMLIENAIGLDFDGIRNIITWRLTEPGRHGIRDFLFNGGRLSLVSHGVAPNGKTKLEICAEKPFTLETLSGNCQEKRSFDIPEGTSLLEVS